MDFRYSGDWTVTIDTSICRVLSKRVSQMRVSLMRFLDASFYNRFEDARF